MIIDIEFKGMELNLNNDEITERFVNGLMALDRGYKESEIVAWLDRNLGLLNQKWLKHNGPKEDDLEQMLLFMRYVGNKFINGWDKSKITR